MNALSFCSICSICTSVSQGHTCHSILLPHCTVQLFGCLDGTQKTGAVPTAKSPRIRGHLQAHHHVVREAAMVDITRRSRPNPFFCKQNGCGPLDPWVELHRSFLRTMRGSDHHSLRRGPNTVSSVKYPLRRALRSASMTGLETCPKSARDVVLATNVHSASKCFLRTTSRPCSAPPWEPSAQIAGSLIARTKKLFFNLSY